MKATDLVKVCKQRPLGSVTLIEEEIVCPKCHTPAHPRKTANGRLYGQHNNPLPNGHWMIPLVGSNCIHGRGETDPPGTSYAFGAIPD